MSGNCLSDACGPISFCRLGVLGIMVLLLQGCPHQPKPTVLPSASPSTPPRSTLSTPSQSTLILEAKTEAATLRTAIAAERIKMAKQTADIRAVKKQALALRNREIENMETISSLKKELSSVKVECDDLRQEVVQLRTKTAAIPTLLEMVTEIRNVEASLHDMGSSLDLLSNELVQLKEEMKNLQVVGVRSPRNRSSELAERISDTEGANDITVQRGDSLWRLARLYDTTVADLKALNNLDNDRIVVGQLLKIPSPDLPLDEEDIADFATPTNIP